MVDSPAVSGDYFSELSSELRDLQRSVMELQDRNHAQNCAIEMLIMLLVERGLAHRYDIETLFSECAEKLRSDGASQSSVAHRIERIAHYVEDYSHAADVEGSVMGVFREAQSGASGQSRN